MGYHDRLLNETTWANSTEKKQETKTENPSMQVISPQKKLFDIQQLINDLPEKPMSMFELQEAIQKILDGR